jgi:hypothetical protein
MPQKTGVPHLVVLAPEAYRGRRIQLVNECTVVGRGESSDVCFDDLYVSRAHAVLQRRGSAVYVRDLESSAGTLVNGTAAVPDLELHPGDVVALADVHLRFEPASAGSDKPSPSPAGTPVHYNIDQVRGKEIDLIGGDKHNYYRVTQQRQAFLREIASTRTKARWLAWTGFLLFIAGFGLFVAPLLSFINQVAQRLESGDVRPPDDILGPDIGGIPSALLGYALAALGLLLLIVGIVLHIVATSRRKWVDRELPVPPPRLMPNH